MFAASLRGISAFYFVSIFIQCRLYNVKKCGGATCPYAASWLVHIDLFNLIDFKLDADWMEQASYKLFTSKTNAYQFQDLNFYFVHHLSQFEHSVLSTYGFEQASHRAGQLSRSSFSGECLSRIDISTDSINYIALIPYYSGLPPNITSWMKVNSNGKGNSLMNESIKSLQCMATVCSCMKYFGSVVIGVSTLKDKNKVKSMVHALPAEFSQHIHIVHLFVPKPYHLPFHLLTWAQHFFHSLKYNKSTFPAAMKNIHSMNSHHIDKIHHSNHKNLDRSNVKNHDKVINKYHNSIKVIDEIFPQVPYTNEIKYVYYTESDQIVRFDSYEILSIISRVSNISSFVLSYRRSKDSDSDPVDYMGSLNNWRMCCKNGYVINVSNSLVDHNNNHLLISSL